MTLTIWRVIFEFILLGVSIALLGIGETLTAIYFVLFAIASKGDYRAK